MTTATKTKKPAKRTTNKKPDLPPLPPTAKVVEVGGRDCVIVPLDEYDDWLQDLLLGAIATDRLNNGDGESITLDEFNARMDKKAKGG